MFCSKLKNQFFDSLYQINCSNHAITIRNLLLGSTYPLKYIYFKLICCILLKDQTVVWGQKGWFLTSSTCCTDWWFNGHSTCSSLPYCAVIDQFIVLSYVTSTKCNCTLSIPQGVVPLIYNAYHLTSVITILCILLRAVFPNKSSPKQTWFFILNLCPTKWLLWTTASGNLIHFIQLFCGWPKTADSSPILMKRTLDHYLFAFSFELTVKFSFTDLISIKLKQFLKIKLVIWNYFMLLNNSAGKFRLELLWLLFKLQPNEIF